MFSSSSRGEDIHLHIGDALTLIEPLSVQPWDLVYIDANKRFYPQYYQRVKPFVNVGGYILADNTLWSDHVLDDDRRDAQTEGIRMFNEIVASDPDVFVVMLPVYDGLTIIKKIR